MQFLLSLSRATDAFSSSIGWIAKWLVLAATVISASNALVRKSFGYSSNAFLEIQWYLFAAVFVLGGGYAFLKNAHVRIDFISAKLSPRTRNWIDVFGIVVFLTPLCLLMLLEGWPVFVNAWDSGEVSSNSGGLLRWPVLLLIPVGFFILLMQGLSELVKRVAYLKGLIADPLAHQDAKAH